VVVAVVAEALRLVEEVVIVVDLAAVVDLEEVRSPKRVVQGQAY